MATTPYLRDEYSTPFKYECLSCGLPTARPPAENPLLQSSVIVEPLKRRHSSHDLPRDDLFDFCLRELPAQLANDARARLRTLFRGGPSDVDHLAALDDTQSQLRLVKLHKHTNCKHYNESIVSQQLAATASFNKSSRALSSSFNSRFKNMPKRLDESTTSTNAKLQ